MVKPTRIVEFSTIDLIAEGTDSVIRKMNLFFENEQIEQIYQDSIVANVKKGWNPA